MLLRHNLKLQVMISYCGKMNFTKIIGSFKNKRILIIGDLILDRYVLGRVNRISPEAPVPIVEVVNETNLLGGSANVANNIKALGGSVSIAGIVGRDGAGKVMRELFGQKGICCDGVVEDKRPTTIKTRVIAHSQQVVRFDWEDRKRLDGKNLEIMMAYLKKAVPEHDGIIISDYHKGVISASLIKTVVKYAKQRNIFVAVDPKVGHFHFYKHVSIITPNLHEASQGSGIDIKDNESLIKAGQTIINRLAIKSLLITRGEGGMSLFEKSEPTKKIKVTHIPTVAQKVFDVTGAGDTAIAAFTLAHCAGASLKDAAVIANHAAGIVVGEVGTAVATPEKLIASLHSTDGQ